MIRSKLIIAIATTFCALHCVRHEAPAQQLYSGTTAAELQYAGNGGIDLNGRAINVDGRTVDRYGHAVDSYGWPARNYSDPRRTAGGFYSSGNNTGTFYSSGANAYPSGNWSGPRGYGISPPRSIVVGGVYPSRTVMNNGTRGTVIEYTHNGNGYISTPGSTYQTVISSGASIFPYTTVVQPSQPPVIIETQPTQAIGKTFRGNATGRPANILPNDRAAIHLVYPQESASPMTYLLNGTIYTIKPGYTQTFSDDRPWTIEFQRSGNGSARVRYDLKAGTYGFVADANGWDLLPFPSAAQPEIPPSPISSFSSIPPLSSVPPLLTEPVPVAAPTPSPPSEQ